MDCKSCIHRDITGEEAENLLLTQGKDGSFLIRPSTSNPDDWSLSVRRNDKIIHIKIQNAGDYYDLHGGEQFATMIDLVKHYVSVEGQGQLKEKGGEFLKLKNPFNATSHRVERWFHGGITSADAEKVLKSQSIGSFLVRESQSKAGDFVLSYRHEESSVIHVMITKKNGKYTVGDGKAGFPCLTNLIDHYRTDKIEVKFGPNAKTVKFNLQQSVNLSVIKASNINTRVVEMDKEFSVQDKQRNGFWEEFEQLQYLEDKEPPKSQKVGGAEENRQKNRYKNILPFDATRVKLKDTDPCMPSSDYINANYVSASEIYPHLRRRYIATQGCLKQTVTDFWHMVWQENVSVIVMTTKLIEMGKNKCFPYWPEENGSSNVLDVYNGKLTVTNIGMSEGNDFSVRTFQIKREKQLKNNSFATETREVYQYHFGSWPDKLAPRDTIAVIQFAKEVNQRMSVLGDDHPIIVHCSAGIGRTGTFILIDIIMNQIKSKGLDCEIDIPKVLSLVRKQRAGMVQTDSQYMFIYKAIQQFVKTFESEGQAEPVVYENLSDAVVASGYNSKPEAPPKPCLPGRSVRKKEFQAYENLDNFVEH